MINERTVYFSRLEANETLVPLILTADTIEDYASAVALALRQRGERAWLPMLQQHSSRLPQLGVEMSSLHAHVGTNDLIPTSEWVQFQRLWWRWQAPNDSVSPMRWYLTAACSATEEPGTLSEAVDLCMQELMLLSPRQRPQYVSVTLGLDHMSGVVAGWGEWQWALPAMLHATLTERPFVWCESEEELVELAHGDLDSLTVCVPPHQLTLELLNQLTDARSFQLAIPRVEELNFFARPISFFTARTLEILTRVTVKHDLYKRIPVERSAWVLTGELPGKETDADVTLLSREEASVGHLELIDRPEIMLLSGHSREDLFHIGPDVLCGASSEAPLRTSEGLLPACAHDGRCIKEGAVLPVNQLPAKMILMGGCNLMRLGGKSTFASEYTLPFSSLEGSSNLVVASRRTRFGYAFELIFMYQLIRGGMEVGEAVRLVNNSLPFSGPESPDYLVLGEGTWRAFASVENRAFIEMTADGEGWRVECREVDAYYVEIRLPSFSEELYVRLPEIRGEFKDLFYALVPEADGSCRVFLFGWRRIQADHLSIWIGPTPPASDLQPALSHTYRNQAYARLFRSYLPKFENREKELRSLGTYIARHLNEAKRQPIAYSEAETKAVEVEALLSRMDRDVCTYLLDRIAASTFVWLDQYMEVDGSFYVAEHLPRDQHCPYCASPVVRRVIRYRFDPAIAREFALCQTCGNVWDIPLEEICPVFTGPAVLTRSINQPQAVRVKNNLGRRVRGWLGFRLYQSQRYGIAIDPPQCELVLEKGETAEIAFTINIGERMPAHMEFIRGFWVSELSVSVFQKNIWVLPAERKANGP